MTDFDLDVALREIAEQQHGVLARWQARAAGADRRMLRARLATPGWEAVTDQVLRLVVSAPTPRQGYMAAVLDAGEGAVLSHHAAAALWQLPGFPLGEPIVTRIRAGTRRAISVWRIHEVRHLPGGHATRVEAIPVTTVARTLFDLAGAVHPGRAERALDNALGRRLTTLHSVRAVVHDLAKRGRRGSTLMRQLLEERGDGYVAPESGLEARYLALLRSAGMPLPELQKNLGDATWVGRVDGLFSEYNVVVEIDSAVHHTSKLDRESDAARDRALRSAGYEVIRITDTQIWYRPEQVVSATRAALAAAATRRSAA